MKSITNKGGSKVVRFSGSWGSLRDPWRGLGGDDGDDAFAENLVPEPGFFDVLQGEVARRLSLPVSGK